MLNAIRNHDGDAHVCTSEIRRFFDTSHSYLGDAKLQKRFLLSIFHIPKKNHTHTQTYA